MKKKNGVLWRRVCSVLLSVAVMCYLAYQIYSAAHHTLTTEYALDYTYHETMSLDGFIVRDEKILTTDASGVVSYSQESGSKVAAGHVVARVCENDEQASVQTQLDEVNDLIESLEGLQEEGTQMAVNAQVLDSRISQTINEYLDILDTGMTDGSQNISKELIRLLNKKQMTLGNTGDVNAYLAQLNAQKASLESSIQSSVPVVTDVSGYFVNQIDGCETAIDYDEIEDITSAHVENALKREVKDVDGIGKMICNSEWYLTAITDTSIAQKVELDEQVDITIPMLTNEVYRCTVAQMSNDYASGNTVLVLKCSQMDEAVASARQVTVQLRTNTYDGLRVRSSALRVVDGISGVYVVDGIAAEFRPITVLYSDSSIVICKKNDSSLSNPLKIYDEVIIEGSGLYDGKVIR